MSTVESVRRWIESGKQIGLSMSYPLGEDTIWISVAVQKWQGLYKVYKDEILESKMAAEEFSHMETSTFETLIEVEKYIALCTRVELTSLKPLKGQRIFNPSIE